MTNIVKGVIEAVKDDGGKKGKYGWQHRVGIKVDGEWYGGWLKKSAEELGIEEGRQVMFTFTENGEYLNYDPKSIKVSETAEPSPSRQGSSSTTRTKVNGQTVGMAINNAVASFNAGKIKREEIPAFASSVLALAGQLEAGKDFRKQGEPAAPADDDQQDNAPPPKRKAKAAAAKPAARKARAEPPPPEDDDDDDAPPPPQEPEGEPDFDDDIPF